MKYRATRTLGYTGLDYGLSVRVNLTSFSASGADTSHGLQGTKYTAEQKAQSKKYTSLD